MTRHVALLRFLAALVWLAALAPAHAQSEGSTRWSFLTSGAVYSSPAVAADGTIYVGNEASLSVLSRLYAIRPDGSLKWQFTGATDWIDSAPAIGPDGTVYVGSWDGKFYAINPANGATKWSYTTLGFVASSAAIAADGTIYVGSGDGSLHAINADGTAKWTYPVGDWIESSPAIGADGTIYFGSYDKSVYALRPDGTLRWSYATGDDVVSSPAIGTDGTVYVGSQDGKIYALDGATGARRWEYATEAAISASPAIGPGGRLYLGSSDGYFYALNLADGTLAWRFNAGSAIFSSAAVRADGTILFGADRYLYGLNPDGSQRWRVTTGDYVDSSPVIASDGTIYVGSYDRRLYAVVGNGQGPATTAPWPAFRRDPLHLGRAPAAAKPVVNASLPVVGQTLRLTAAVSTASPTPAYQWHRDGAALTGATTAELVLANFQPADSGFYSVSVQDGASTLTSEPVLIAPELTPGGYTGTVLQVLREVVHPNGNIYDQYLLTGAGGSMAARANRVTRVSFVDQSDDIVQVEFSGTGTVTLALDALSGPQPPANYNQPTVSYMKGHARIYFANTGPDSNLSVFSVGPANAVNAALFRPEVNYDGVADIGLIGLSSPTRSFAGLRAANAAFFNTQGDTGLRATAVSFSGPAYVHDVTATDSARSSLRTGTLASGELWITGGNLQQDNGAAVEITDLQHIVMKAGTDSHKRLQPAQTNRARISREGVDVTATVVINPPASNP